MFSRAKLADATGLPFLDLAVGSFGAPPKIEVWRSGA
jgi:hypothetical protein